MTTDRPQTPSGPSPSMAQADFRISSPQATRTAVDAPDSALSPDASFPDGPADPSAPSGRPLEMRVGTRRGLVFSVGFIVVWFATWNLAGLLPGGSGVSLWYPTAGLTMALFLTFGVRFMPLAFIAGFIGIVAADRSAPSADLLIYATLGAGIPVLCYGFAAWFLTTALGFDRRFSNLRTAIQFLITMPLAAMGTSLAAVAPVFLSGGLPARAFVDMWLGWWLGDLLGLLTVTPALLICAAPRIADWVARRPVQLQPVRSKTDGQPDVRTTRSRAGKMGVIIAMIIGGGAVLAASGLPYSRADNTSNGLELGFLIFLPLIWIGVRFGVVGTAIAVLVITTAMALLTAVTETGVASGPYQLLIGSIAAIGLTLGAAVSARNAAMANLERARLDLEQRVEARTRDLRAEVDRRTDAEAHARAAQRLAEAASSAKSTAISQMTHEFRTPLNAIIGFSDMMRGEVLGPLGNHRYGQYADHIHSSGRHLLTMLDNIIDLSRVEAGQVTLSADQVDLAALAAEVSGLLRPDSDRKNIFLTFDQPATAWICGDECRLRQILINLLSNAIKYTPAGGAIETAISILDDGRIRLAVMDTGHGIDPEDLPHLGQPFFRGHHAERLQESGTGIGLTVVYQYARLHGATVTFDSTVGEGTTVTVIFPKPSPAPTASPSPGPAPRPAPEPATRSAAESTAEPPRELAPELAPEPLAASTKDRPVGGFIPAAIKEPIAAMKQ